PPPRSARSSSTTRPCREKQSVSDIQFQPTFTHADWVDNVDRIVAGGPKGFNIRLNAIESDLQQLSTVVGQIDTALDQLAAATSVPPSGEQHAVFPVAMVGLSTTGNQPGWFHDVFGEAHPHGGTEGGVGVMGLSLPDGIKITSFRVIGRFSTAAASNVSIVLG